jgi:TP901 family phage tail tape measure protein
VAEIIKTVIDVELNSGQFSADLKALQQQVNAFNLTLNKSSKAQGQASKLWAGELSTLINRSGFFKAELTKIQTSAGALDSTLKKGQATLGQFFSASFNKRSSMAAEVFALAAERARTMETQFIATGKASKGMQEVLAIRPLTAFSSDASVAAQRAQILGSMFKQGTTQLINFGKNVQWAGRQLMVGFTVPLTIFGATAGKIFRELEMEVVAFKKVYGDLFTTPAELNQNLEAVKGLASEYTKYGIAVKDTIGLAAQAAAAGRQNADLTDAVREATRLSTLGQMSQNQALETTIALQSAFKLSGQELADTVNFLNMVENQTVVSLEDLAAAIPRVAPVIKGLGGDVKDLSVFLAAMQEGGVSAEQGANALKSGLASLINPTKNAKEVLGGFNINLDAIIQKNRGDLMGTVMDFSKALQTLDEFSRQQALEETFGKFQYARLGALFENIGRDGSQATQVMETMAYTSEELAATAEKELKTISEAFSVQLVGAVERLKLAIAPIGELFVKMAIPVINFLTKIAEWFNSLPEGVKNFVSLATVITGLIVPAATMMFGLFMNLVGTLAKMTQGAAIFAATLFKGGPIAALKSLAGSSQYLSLAEIDAANAARQLGSATQYANEAILQQTATMGTSRVAADTYTAALRRMIAAQAEAALLQPAAFGRGASAAQIALSKGRRKGFNKGGPVPGSGNTDTVPAMLTPGEFVVRKEAAEKNRELLEKINGKPTGYAKGGIIYANGGASILQPIIDDALNQTVALNAKNISAARVDSKVVSKGAAEALSSFNFSGGKTNPKEQRIAYLQAVEFYEMLDGQQNAQNEYVKNLEKRTNLRGKGKERVNTTVAQNSFKDVLKGNFANSITYFDAEGKKTITALDALKSEKLSDFLSLDVTDRSHIGARTEVLKQPLITGHGTVPKGIPLQVLDNKVLDLSTSLNKRLSKKGVPASEMLKYISTPSTREKMFSALNGQFDEFLKTVSPEDQKTLKAEFDKAKTSIYDDLISELKSRKDTIITDRGQSGTKKFEDITKTAFKNLSQSKNVQLAEFDKLLSFEQNYRIPPLSDMQEIAEKINKDISDPKKHIPISNNRGQMLLNVIEHNTGKDSEALKFVNNFLETDKNGNLKVKETQFKSNQFSVQKLGQKLASLLPKIAFSTVAGRRGFNAGGPVPGSGNTDTVPAMLTPGEFVVNKEATEKNRALLHAINGKTAGFMKGGVVYANKGVELPNLGLAGPASDINTRQPVSPSSSSKALGAARFGGGVGMAGGIAGMVGATPIFGMSEQLGGSVQAMIAGFAAMSAIQKTVTIGFKLLTKQPIKLADDFKILSKAFKLLKIPLTASAIGWTSLAAGVVVLGYVIKKQKDQMENAGAELTAAMYGSAKSVQGLADVFGTQSNIDRLQSSRVQRAAQGITEESQQFSTQYMQSDAGKQMMVDIQRVKDAGGDAAEAIRNQLVTGVISGVITADQAKAIAGDIGLALKDQNLAIEAVGSIVNLIGPNGELLQNNLLKITGEITPKINLEGLRAQAEADYEKMGWIGKLFTSKELVIEGNMINNISQSLVSANEAVSQSIAEITFQYEDQQITYEEYKEKSKELTDQILANNDDAAQSLADTIGVEKEELSELYNAQYSKGMSGDRRRQIEDTKKFFNDQKNAAKEILSEPLGDDMGAEISDAVLEGLAGGDALKAGEYFAQIATGNISPQMALEIWNYLTSNGFKEQADAFQKAFMVVTPTAPVAGGYLGYKVPPKTEEGIDPSLLGPGPGGDKESAFARIQKETAATKNYYAAVTSLVKGGIKPENVALLQQNDLLEMSTSQRKKAIDMLKQQTETTKILEYVMLSAEERNIKNLQDNSKIIDRQISLNQRRIDDVLKLNEVEQDRIKGLERQNELDQRQVALRNKALDAISKKEDQINNVYNSRNAVLEKVTQLNDVMASQQKARMDLASALTSGDFGAAASAAQSLSSQYASDQLNATKDALEQQKQAELASITAEVNGQLMTRQQLEDQIDQIGERVYQRNLIIQQQNDIIYEREQQILPFKQAINGLEEQRLKLTRELEDAEYNKWKTELDNLRTATKGWSTYWTSRRGGGAGSIGNATKSSSTKKKDQKKNFGGFIKRAYGGMINFRGSNEAPPPLLRANVGMEVPGVGITDKVPALLTPGEFVVRKSVAQQNMPFLKALNNQVFPDTASFSSGMESPVVSDNSSSTINAPVYNNYNVSVNVAETDVSANDIANAVITKIRMQEGRGIRRNRI